MPTYNELKAATGVQFVYNENTQALGLLVEVEGGHRTIFETSGAVLSGLWIQLRDGFAAVPKRRQWQGHFPARTTAERDELSRR